MEKLIIIFAIIQVVEFILFVQLAKFVSKYQQMVVELQIKVVDLQIEKLTQLKNKI